MEINKKTPANNYNFDRERFSNFVVDLRNVEKKAVYDLKSEARAAKKGIGIVKGEAGIIKDRGQKIGWRIKKSLEKDWKKLETAAKKITPNLLLPGKPVLFRKPRTFFSDLPNIFWRSRLLKNKRLAWATELKAREAAWQRALNLKVSRLKVDARAGARKRRADKTEAPKETVTPKKAAAPTAWYRSVLYFSLILFLIILPFKILSALDILDFKRLEEKIVSRSELAVNSLMAAADSISKMDLKNADADFQSAGANFLEAQNDLNKINDSLLVLAAFSSDPKIKLAAESKKFLAAGATASSLGRNLVLATDSLFSGDKNNFRVSLDNFLAYGNLAVSDAKSLKKTVAKINPDNLPEAYRAKFESLSQQAGLLSDNLDNFVSAGAKLKEVLGSSRDKRYLLVFQNNAEMRGSGGFLGSYALVDIRDGQIRNLEVPGGGSYDTEGGMKISVVAPEPLWLVSPLWHFWDANWWPDWPTTAKNLMWFYEKSGGPSVDGVISVTPTVVERLLEITGPIDLTAEYDLIIDKDNFWETVQKITERENLAKTHPEAIAGLPATSTVIKSDLPLEQGLDINSENKPKKIIGDLLAKILEILPQKLNKENLVKIITIWEENMSEKQILFYFNDSTLQSEFVSRNWAGEVRPTDRDYLMVVNTNIAGQKSDRLMSEKIDLASEAGTDGDLINTVTITRTHNGLKNEALTGVRNVNWLRVYVPLGSKLLGATGFVAPEAQYLQDKPEADWVKTPLLTAEMAAATDSATGVKIYTENNKTVFANWLMVDPGQTATVVIKYRLPFNIFTAKVDDSWLKRLNGWLNADAPQLLPYSLLVQKQPGSRPSEFTSRLRLPDNLNVFWRWPEDSGGPNGWEISAPLDSDKYYSLLLEKKN
ncbi:MAG: DUF4012 domain-containing protein [bacterium]|nr:DUF4012 domain-containing protein [bacterium]